MPDTMIWASKQTPSNLAQQKKNLNLHPGRHNDPPLARVGVRFATLQTTLPYVCFFGQNYATELRPVIFCYVTELRTLK